MKRLLTTAAATIALTIAAPAFAQDHAGHGDMDHSQHAMPGMDHSQHGGALKASEPAEGSTVAAPKALTLTFPHAMKLDSVTLTGPSGQPFKLKVVATGSRETVSTPLPALQGGAWQAAWHATGADGHMMSGVVKFSVR
ncbi:copper resistance CopC family protein [Caulobacter sp. 17J65-9]|uniref:copper resistance CopC family protein n=1 Tax=Caulobacter sp. 17J65-9 TaxID=2709382 RepID=UPI0013CAF91C|nr:copper resistance CopC family protein [Caulobacter sp. 17J65-9]NEX91239.1 copper resistance protein CopC [Caulobacter sp. 17J65-9]